MKMMSFFTFIFLVSCSTTSFTGQAHMTPEQCEKKCSGWDMEMDAMVALGDYSDACVCRKKKSAPLTTAETASAVGEGMQLRELRQMTNTPRF
ncbi:MAG: hypothetical protein ACJ76H_12510 [Bacteriovoracaceae bacterium]